MADSTTIAILPADRNDRRLRLSMLANSTEGSGLRLIDETYSEAVGWFAQGHVDLSPGQINALRSALGTPQRTTTRERASRRSAMQVYQASELPTTVSLSAYRAG